MGWLRQSIILMLKTRGREIAGIHLSISRSSSTAVLTRKGRLELGAAATYVVRDGGGSTGADSEEWNTSNTRKNHPLPPFCLGERETGRDGGVRRIGSLLAGLNHLAIP